MYFHIQNIFKKKISNDKSLLANFLVLFGMKIPYNVGDGEIYGETLRIKTNLFS
jgi:hypothetical protein